MSNTSLSVVMLHAISADGSDASAETIAPALPQNEPTIATAHVTATSLVLNLTIFLTLSFFVIFLHFTHHEQPNS